MNMMLRIQGEARRRGFALNELTSEMYEQIAKDIRTLPELMRDGTARYVGQAQVWAGRVVSLPVRQKREQICRTNKCGMFSVLADGEPACNGCNCCGTNLMAKISLPGSICPHDPPLWEEDTCP